MYNNKSLAELQKMAITANKQLDIQMAIFEKSIQEVKKNVSDDEKIAIEKLQGLSQKAINLAKKGKSNEATELIKNFNYGGKGNK